MLNGFDILLIIAAFILLIWGMVKRYRLWEQGNPQKLDGSYRIIRIGKVIKHVLGHKKVMQDRYGGISHLFVFWGFMLPLIIVIIAQFRPTVGFAVAKGISLLMDVLGFLALFGTGMLLYKALSDGRGKRGDRLIHLWTLLAILTTGFLAEGTRLQIVEPMNSSAQLFSPIGLAISYVMPPSPLLLKLLVRTHFFLVLFFIAQLPFTAMRHAVAACMNVYYQKLERRGLIKPMVLQGDYFGTGKIEDFTCKDLLDLDACMNCARCERSCPAFVSGQPLSPRRFIRELGKQMAETHAVSHLDNYSKPD